MKLVHTITISVLTLLSCFNLHGQEKVYFRNLAPYFHIKGSEGPSEQFPLKHLKADVNIAATIADVTLTQQFVNTGHSPIEATYVFPGSTSAAVYAMKMVIGEREIQAEIKEKSEAQKIYKKARDKGQRASLLEQHRSNVFEMSVANLMPGDTITTIISYTEMIEPIQGRYKFVLPTTVGPRYKESSEEIYASNEKWVGNPYLTEGRKPNYEIQIDTKIATGVPIQSMRSVSHEVNIQYNDVNKCSISLKEHEKYSATRDYILEYYLRGREIETGILVKEGEDENFFTLIIQPPRKVENEMMPPKEYQFLIDISGSMSGFPLELSKDMMDKLLRNLKPTDLFNVNFFSSGSKKVFERSVPATDFNIRRAFREIDRLNAWGGTNLYRAFQSLVATEISDEFSRSIVVITDGYVMAEKEVFNIIEENIDNTNVFAFGIGAAVNRYLIEGMARKGMGQPFVVNPFIDPKEKAREFYDYIRSPALTNISVDFGENGVYDVFPNKIPDLMSERPIIIHGKYFGELSDTIRLSGNYGMGKYEVKVIPSNESKIENKALNYLWARNQIASLTDYTKGGVVERYETKRIGLKYSLLTDYTSFVAVDDEIVNASGNLSEVRQPIPLPFGVTNNAVGNYRASMNATGATSRCIGYGSNPIFLLTPWENMKHEFVNDFLPIYWQPSSLGYYELTISNVFNDTLFSELTEKTNYWLHLSELNEQANLYIVRVTASDGEAYGFEEAFSQIKDYKIRKISSPDLPQDLMYYFEMAEYYEDKNLLLDALSAYLIGTQHYPESKALREALDHFLIKNGFMSY